LHLYETTEPTPPLGFPVMTPWATAPGLVAAVHGIGAHLGADPVHAPEEEEDFNMDLTLLITAATHTHYRRTQHTVQGG